MTDIDPTLETKAAELIRAGGLVAMPTETVYGLAADATNDAAVAKIFAAKGRPQFNPLIIHVTGEQMASRYVEISPLAKKLIDAFWPGPLTLVLPRKENCNLSLLVSAGLETVAVRAPNHPIAQSLIATIDRPLAAPSANRSGTISPSTPAHAQQSLGSRVDLVIDGGPCRIGLESTIVKIENHQATLLRPGGIAREEIEKLLGKKLSQHSETVAPQAPGMLASHYAPNALLRLNALSPHSDEAYLGFGPTAKKIAASGNFLNLSPSGDLIEAAANLFSFMRRADQLCKDKGLKGIATAPIPSHGLGEAINDRLQRAAAPR